MSVGMFTRANRGSTFTATKVLGEGMICLVVPKLDWSVRCWLSLKPHEVQNGEAFEETLTRADQELLTWFRVHGPGATSMRDLAMAALEHFDLHAIEIKRAGTGIVLYSCWP
jgi:hypothetical protein